MSKRQFDSKSAEENGAKRRKAEFVESYYCEDALNENCLTEKQMIEQGHFDLKDSKYERFDSLGKCKTQCRVVPELSSLIFGFAGNFEAYGDKRFASQKAKTYSEDKLVHDIKVRWDGYAETIQAKIRDNRSYKLLYLQTSLLVGPEQLAKDLETVLGRWRNSKGMLEFWDVLYAAMVLRGYLHLLMEESKPLSDFIKGAAAFERHDLYSWFRLLLRAARYRRFFSYEWFTQEFPYVNQNTCIPRAWWTNEDYARVLEGFPEDLCERLELSLKSLPVFETVSSGQAIKDRDAEKVLSRMFGYGEFQYAPTEDYGLQVMLEALPFNFVIHFAHHAIHSTDVMAPGSMHAYLLESARKNEIVTKCDVKEAEVVQQYLAQLVRRSQAQYQIRRGLIKQIPAFLASIGTDKFRPYVIKLYNQWAGADLKTDSSLAIKMEERRFVQALPEPVAVETTPAAASTAGFRKTGGFALIQHKF